MRIIEHIFRWLFNAYYVGQIDIRVYQGGGM